MNLPNQLRRLAEGLEDTWSASEDGFRESCLDLLQSIPILDSLDLAEFLDSFSPPGLWPTQSYGVVAAQGAVTLLQATSGRFCIDVMPICGANALNLPSADLGVHGVLHGSVLVTDDIFHARSRVGDHLRLGERKRVGIFTARAGDVLSREPILIDGYRSFSSIEGATLLLRILKRGATNPQKRYYQNGAEVKTSAREWELAMKRVSFFCHLRETTPREAEDFGRGLVSRFPAEIAAAHFTGLIPLLEGDEVDSFTELFSDSIGLNRESIDALVNQARAMSLVPREEVKAFSKRAMTALVRRSSAEFEAAAGELSDLPEGGEALRLVLAAAHQTGVPVPTFHVRDRISVPPAMSLNPALSKRKARDPEPRRDSFFEAVARLGDSVDREWDRRGRNLEAFPALAIDALRREEAALRDFDAGVIANWLLSTIAAPTPFTFRDTFGSPSITLWRSPDEDIVIEILCWRDFDTAIHDHGFAGAWTVLQGMSLQATYRFAESERLAEGVWSGDLHLERIALLEKNDVHAIGAGEGFIHQVIHLAVPTVSFIVRTTKAKNDVAQSSYFRSGVKARYAPGSAIWWLTRLGRSAIGRLPREISRALLAELADKPAKLDGELARMNVFFDRYAPSSPEREAFRVRIEENLSGRIDLQETLNLPPRGSDRFIEIGDQIIDEVFFPRFIE